MTSFSESAPHVVQDSWLSDVLGRDVFRVGATSDAAASVREHMRGRTGFYFGKIDATSIGVLKDLLGVGFFVADVNVAFGAAPRDLDPGPISPSISTGLLPDGKTEEVLRIAYESFRYSRFHLDPLFSVENANHVKREWVRSYAEGKRGDRLFVATIDTELVGFLAALRSPGDAPTATIDLIGVSRRFQRRGVGRALIAHFARHYHEAAELQVGTQIANTPSVRLYESIGLRLKTSQYVIHMHVRDGAPT